MKMASCRFCFNSLTFNACTQSTTQLIVLFIVYARDSAFTTAQNFPQSCETKSGTESLGSRLPESLVSSTLLPLHSWSSHMKGAWIRFIRCMGNLIKQKGFLLLPPPLKFASTCMKKLLLLRIESGLHLTDECQVNMWLMRVHTHKEKQTQKVLAKC